MSYYDEQLKLIEKLVQDKNYIEARSLIHAEFDQAYVPKDFQERLNEIINDIGEDINNYSFNEDELLSFLYASKEKQLIAVDYLNGKNLREYIDVCNEFLSSDGFLNAKVLLVDSLIRQEIGDEIKMSNNGLEYTFIPKYLLPVEESYGYLSAYKYLNDVYMKEPSKCKIALDILYKELIMLLPVNQDEDEGILIAKDIEKYVDKAFAQ